GQPDALRRLRRRCRAPARAGSLGRVGLPHRRPRGSAGRACRRGSPHGRRVPSSGTPPRPGRRRPRVKRQDHGRSGDEVTVTIQPELWVERPSEAVRFYETAVGAAGVHRVGEGDAIVAQLAVGDAAFWVAPPSAPLKRLSPRTIGGATSRTLLVVDDPERVIRQAVGAGAEETSPAADEHGWRLGRIVDPFGHEWEIGKPLGPWPPE